MGYASLVCTYLYGAFIAVKATIEGLTQAAKGILKRIDTLVSTLMTTITYMINTTMRTVINLVKQYEKELFDMLYNAIFGEDKSFWCNKLWKCAALLAELLNADSWLNQKIRRALERKCRSTAALDVMDLISQSITDFSAFQQTVCDAGFTIEFGISYIKKLFEMCASLMDEYLRFIERNYKRLRLLIDEYLNMLIDWGLFDYLDTLMSFFTCAFDDSYSCSEIATAQNYYAEALSVFKIEKKGSGYDVSTEFKNSVYGSLDGTKNQISNLKQEIDAAYAKCVDPGKLKKANAAYNLSKNIFPGGMSWDDIKEGNWKNNHIVQKFELTKESFIQAWKGYKPNDDITFKELMDGTYIDQSGSVYVKDGCNYVKLDSYLPLLPSPKTIDCMVSAPVDNDAMVWNDEIISVTDAAYRIATNAEGEENQRMIAECRSLYEFINDWKHNPEGAIRYNEQVI